MRDNGEDVRLILVPFAHTDGDTMVYFPNANGIMTKARATCVCCLAL